MTNDDAPFVIYRISDGEFLQFDAATIEQHSPEVRLSEHPVENGVDVVDHAQRLPDRFTVTAVLTESPRVLRDDPAQSGPERIRSALRFLEACVGETLAVQLTRTSTVFDAMLEAWPYPIDNTRRVEFSLRFRRVVQVQSSTVQIPVRQPPASTRSRVASPVDAGLQGPTPATGAGGVLGDGTDPVEAEDASWAYQLLHALGQV